MGGPPSDAGSAVAPSDRYDAFLSYSHAADVRVASALQHALQRLGAAWWQPSALRVFRDETSLSASPALWPAIAAELARARYLILLASPAAAQSPWVGQEVDWWMTHRRADHLLLALTDGVLAWDRVAGGPDPKRTDCLPFTLGVRLRAEPLYVDLRWARAHRGRLTLRDRRFRDAALTLAAPLHGVRKEVLEGSEQRRARRGRRSAAAAGLAVAALAAGGGTAAWRARTAAAQSDANWREAQSRRLAAMAIAALADDDANTAIQLAVLGWRLDRTEEARAALDTVSARTAAVPRILGQHRKPIEALAFSGDGSRLASVARDGSVLVWGTDRWARVGPTITAGVSDVAGLRLDESGAHALVVGSRGAADGLLLELWEVGSGRRLGRTALDGGYLSEWELVLSPSGTQVAAFKSRRYEMQLLVWDATTGAARRAQLPALAAEAGGLAFPRDDEVTLVAHDTLGRALRVLRWDPRIGVLRVGVPSARLTGAGRGDTAGYGIGFLQPARSRSGRHLVTWRPLARYAYNHRPVLWTVDPALGLRERPLADSRLVYDGQTSHGAPSVAFDRDDRFARVVAHSAWELWALESAVPRLLARGADSARRMAWSPDGRWRAAANGRWYDGETIAVTALPDGAPGPVALAAGCGPGENRESCARRLCEKVFPSLDSARLVSLFSIRNYEVFYHTYRARIDAATCGRD